MINKNLTLLLFIAILITSVFQLYFIHLFGSYFSIVFILIILLIPSLFTSLKFYEIKIIFYIILLISITLLSLIWSVDIKIGLKNALWYLFFVILFFTAFKLTTVRPSQVLLSMKIYFLFLLIPIILIIVFRLNPNIEASFIYGSVSKLFINPNIIAQINNDILTNISDPNKAGGFFVNANVAGTYLGVNYFILIGLFIAYRNRYYLIMSLITSIGIVFAGSKASILIFLLLNISLLLRKQWKKIFFLLPIVIISIIIIHRLLPLESFNNEILKTMNIRILIWSFAVENFISHPIIGLGFGEWMQRFEEYADSNAIHMFPPHNTIIALWSDSGIIAAILGLLIIYCTLKYGIALQKIRNKQLNGLGVAVFFSFSWVFLQGMGENFGLLGDEHMKVILAIILGYSYAYYVKFLRSQV